MAIHLARDQIDAVLPTGWQTETQVPLQASKSEPEPDLAVVQGPRRRYLDHHPTGSEVALVVEVSDTSLEEDRVRKCRIYAAAGIDAYWIINLVERQVEVYSQPRASAESPDNIGYEKRRTYLPDEQVPLVIAGQSSTAIAVDELLP